MSAQALLFDFGGTLDSTGLSWLKRLYPLYLDQGIRVPREEFARAFYASDDGLAGRFRLEGLDLEETVRLQVRCVLASLAPGRAEVLDAIVGPFVAESREGLRQSRAVLERLRGAAGRAGGRLALGVVSNFYGNLESVLREEGFQGLFDVVADSGVVGCLKPEPGIFRYAVGRLGTDPARTWMVGDSIERDMKGAENAGLPHAWLRGGRRDPACCPKARVLGSLAELGSVLEPAAA